MVPQSHHERRIFDLHPSVSSCRAPPRSPTTASPLSILERVCLRPISSELPSSSHPLLRTPCEHPIKHINCHANKQKDQINNTQLFESCLIGCVRIEFVLGHSPALIRTSPPSVHTSNSALHSNRGRLVTPSLVPTCHASSVPFGTPSCGVFRKCKHFHRKKKKKKKISTARVLNLPGL